MIIEWSSTCRSTLSKEAKKGNFSNRDEIEKMVELTLKDGKRRFLIQRNGIECFAIIPQNPYIENCPEHNECENVQILLFHCFREYEVKRVAVKS
jgi:hypothetical protein